MAETYVDHRTYKPTGGKAADKFFADLQSGQTADGKTWTHKQGAQGLGWYTSDGAAPPPAPADPANPNAPPPPGTPTRPSDLGPQTPMPPSPAPQIPLGSPNQPQTTPAPGGAQTTPGVNVAPPLQDASAPADPMQAQLRTAIMDLLGTNMTDVSVTDPTLAPQSRAYEAAVNRAALQQRAELMEGQSASGVLDSGATTGAAQRIQQEAGQAIGQKNADLIAGEMQARREQLELGIQVAKEMGMQQEANDLSRQLANLDADLKTRGMDVTREGYQLSRDLAQLDNESKQYLADLDATLRREGYSVQERLGQLDAEIRRLGITSQADLGQLELALRRELGIGELNLGLLGLQQQGQQFNDQLGFDIGQWQSGLNRDALLAALGG